MFAEDLTPFFSTADFASAATLNGAAVNGILDAGYLETLADDVDSLGHTFLCPKSAVPTAAQGDTLVVGSTTYRVRSVEPAGTDLVELRLEQT